MRGRALPLCILVLGAACANPKGGGRQSVTAIGTDSPASAPAVLALVPDSIPAHDALQGLARELGSQFRLEVRVVGRDTKSSEIARFVQSVQPRAIVLMNNPTVRSFRNYRASAPPSERAIPAIGLLTSFLRESARGVDNLSGVIYEVPLLTSVVNLRTLVERKVRKVGVLHRSIFGRFLDEQARLARTEGIELVRVEVDGESPGEIRKGLEALQRERGVDAVWVLNDNRLLAPAMVRDGWVPSLRDYELPVIVNVRSLLSERVQFGSFAVLPDHEALGSQAGQMLLGLADRNWEGTRDGEFEYPVAVRKVLDVEFARENLSLVESELDSVDELVD